MADNNPEVCARYYHSDMVDDVFDLFDLKGIDSNHLSNTEESKVENNDEEELEAICQRTISMSKTCKPPAPDGTNKGKGYHNSIQSSGQAHNSTKLHEWTKNSIKFNSLVHQEKTKSQ
ncbi:hypothetical protein RSAG8_02252, partial [Rhizoctonia solani AG-8 WAC10335]